MRRVPVVRIFEEYRPVAFLPMLLIIKDHEFLQLFQALFRIVALFESLRATGNTSFILAKGKLPGEKKRSN